MAYVPGSLHTLTRNWTNLSLRTKGLVIFAVPALALLIAAILLVLLEHQEADANERIRRAFEARSQLETMYIVLISAESEIRNYGLNGREDGLQPFGLARTSIDVLFGRIKDLIDDQPDEVRHLAQIQQLVHSRLDGLKELREYYHADVDRGTPTPAELRARARISPDVLLAFNDLATAEGKRIQDRAKTDAGHREQLEARFL